jgi:hypothetical protein
MTRKLTLCALTAALVLATPAVAPAAQPLACSYDGAAGNFWPLADGMWNYAIQLTLDCSYVDGAGQRIATKGTLDSSGTFQRSAQCGWIALARSTSGRINFFDSRVPDVTSMSYTMRVDEGAMSIVFHHVDGTYVSRVPINPPGYPDSRRAGWAAGAVITRETDCALSRDELVDLAGTLVLTLP